MVVIGVFKPDMIRNRSTTSQSTAGGYFFHGRARFEVRYGVGTLVCRSGYLNTKINWNMPMALSITLLRFDSQRQIFLINLI